MNAWFSGFDQISFATDDLDRAIGFWERQMGVGPWTVFRNVTMECVCRGQETTVRIDVALVYQN